MTLDLPAILEELAQSYRQRGSDAGVATMTIVVFFDDETIGELARNRIRMLASKHPSRVIVLDATAPETAHRIEGWDWIEVGVRGCGPQMLRSAVDALRLRDAPVVLLWIARDIGSDARFAALCEAAATVVYNSSLLDGGPDALRELARYVEKHPALEIADIAYLRLAPWQESIALLFDGEALAELADVRSVEVTCGSDSEALYLLGWLASRLDWNSGEAGELRDRDGRPIAISLERSGEPRRIARVALRSSRSTFVAELEGGGESIQLSVSGPSVRDARHRAIQNPGIAALVERAILWAGDDRIFRAALGAAGTILARRTREP
jgi:glucose-6-phosphate dehydrogenase assembly protein OpcA